MKRSSMWMPTTCPNATWRWDGWPSRSIKSMICSSLHSSAHGAAAIRGGRTSRDGAAASPASAISLTPRGKLAEVATTAARRSKVGEIADEFLRLLDENQRVLAALAREQHDRRLVRHRVEERIGREVDLAVGAHRRDPADRPRRDDRLEGIARQPVVVLAGVVEHGALRVGNMRCSYRAVGTHLPVRARNSLPWLTLPFRTGWRSARAAGAAGPRADAPAGRYGRSRRCARSPARPSAASTARS